MNLKNDKYVSPSTIKRFPLYYRQLKELLDEGTERVSSREIAKMTGISASLIRQDLGSFGELYGRQGFGYTITELMAELTDALGVEEPVPAIIVGAGITGQAVYENIKFENFGCTLTGIFDKNPYLYGNVIGEHTVISYDELPRFCRSNKPEIAVICLPKESVESVCKNLIGLGINNFWNFSRFNIKYHFKDVNSEEVQFGDSLLSLVQIVNKEKKDNAPKTTDTI